MPKGVKKVVTPPTGMVKLTTFYTMTTKTKKASPTTGSDITEDTAADMADKEDTEDLVTTVLDTAAIVDIETEGPTEAKRAKNAVVKEKKKRTNKERITAIVPRYFYQPRWKNDFKWHTVTNYKLKIVGCTICQGVGVTSDWAIGAKQLTHWRSWAFKAHSKSEEHQLALKNPTLVKEMKVAKDAALAKTTNGLQNNMEMVLFAIQNELPLHKLTGLYQQADYYGPGMVPSKHRSSFAVYDIVRSLNTAITEADHEELKNCLAFTVHIDESTDAYECKKMVVYVHYVDPSMDKHVLTTDMLMRCRLTDCDSRLYDYSRAAEIWLGLRSHYSMGRPGSRNRRKKCNLRAPDDLTEEFEGFSREELLETDLLAFTSYGFD